MTIRPLMHVFKENALFCGIVVLIIFYVGNVSCVYQQHQLPDHQLQHPDHDHPLTRSIEGGRGCNNFVPVLGGDGTKRSPTGDIFDQLPGEMS